MAKGKSKGRNGGGGGVATIIGTNNADTINFINKQVKDLGLKSNVVFEFRDRKTSDGNVGGFVSFSNTFVKETLDSGYFPYKDKVTIINNSSMPQKGTIAHELKHIEQMQSGRFRYVAFKENGKWVEGYEWNGKLHTTSKQYKSIQTALKRAKTKEQYDKALARYQNLPWEKEAYAAGNKYK